MNKMFQDIKNQFLLDYHTNKLTLFLEMFGTLTSLIGAFTMATTGQHGNFYFILSFYLMGSVTWTIAAKRRNNSFNMLLSICYSIVNIIGLTKLFLGM